MTGSNGTYLDLRENLYSEIIANTRKLIDTFEYELYMENRDDWNPGEVDGERQELLNWFKENAPWINIDKIVLNYLTHT